ncbi:MULTISPECIES: hypothetical protein [unclassified Curtobacterium]|uniref:hypothetical protein n=1 Tax=unclassified Curtobacterium TaxID=257496 RepID=UPI0011B47BBE|nr:MULTISPECIES: hypothetical protein [unclassified Curtobacterium]
MLLVSNIPQLWSYTWFRDIGLPLFAGAGSFLVGLIAAIIALQSKNVAKRSNALAERANNLVESARRKEDQRDDYNFKRELERERANLAKRCNELLKLRQSDSRGVIDQHWETSQLTLLDYEVRGFHDRSAADGLLNQIREHLQRADSAPGPHPAHVEIQRAGMAIHQYLYEVGYTPGETRALRMQAEKRTAPWLAEN